ncbi:MAG: hypothetical protein M3433_05520 [Actinomycetota bacterium]|nr:hypothetical protein [Actinomycetota bacterium]
MRKVVFGCFVLAALSLLLPARGLHFDSWAWVVWGRQIPLLELDTLGGPSWKPFPVIFTTVFAPLSKLDDGIPAMLWLVVARAGGFLSIAMAYRLASRLVEEHRPSVRTDRSRPSTAGSEDVGGPERWIALCAGVTAGAVMCITPRWGLLIAQGYTEPLAAGLLLWGIERHLDGHRGHAFFLCFLVALNRPEFWPFLGAYAVFLLLKEPRHRALVAGCLVLLPALWLVPEWIGSGDPFSAGKQARSEPAWSLSHQDHPWLAALHRSAGLMLHPLKLCALFGLVWGIHRRNWAIIAMGGAVAFWLVLVSIMTQGGFSGNPRYFLLAVGLTTVLAGIGVARLVAIASTTRARVAITALLVLVIAPFAYLRAPHAGRELSFATGNATLHHQFEDAVRKAGGPAAVVEHGKPFVNRGFVTHMAWELKLPIRAIQRKGAPRRVVFTVRYRHSGRPPTIAVGSHVQTLTEVGPWRVLEVNGPPPDGIAASVAAPR